MRDHLSWKTISFWQKVLHISVNEPVTKDHLSSESIFLRPMEWSFKRVSTVQMFSDMESDQTVSVRDQLPAYYWVMAYRQLKPFLRPYGSIGEGRLNFYHRTLSEAVRQQWEWLICYNIEHISTITSATTVPQFRYTSFMKQSVIIDFISVFATFSSCWERGQSLIGLMDCTAKIMSQTYFI